MFVLSFVTLHHITLLISKMEIKACWVSVGRETGVHDDKISAGARREPKTSSTQTRGQAEIEPGPH